MTSRLQRRGQWHRNIQQSALLEFASLKSSCPEGIYLSLRPGNPSQWSGILFVREGPYSSAVLRFQVSLPWNYPTLPPSITFTTDIFHPLITPLTTYTYTTGSLSSDTVSATDEERLPPGGFSLRHGFPHWFGRAKKSGSSSTASSRNVSGSQDTLASSYSQTNLPSDLASPTRQIANLHHAISVLHLNNNSAPSILEVLCYMKKTFDDATALDMLPLEAAGNPGAWNAWRAYRKIVLQSMNPDSQMPPTSGGNKPLTDHPKQQDEWSWEGVWEERVQKGMNASISDAALYGNAGGGDDLIHFMNIDDSLFQVVKKQALDAVAD